VQLATATTPNAVLQANLDAARNVLRADPDALGLRLDELAAIIARATPSIATIARWNPKVLAYASRPGFRAVLLNLVNVGSTAIRMMGALPRLQLDLLEAPIDRLQSVVLQLGIAVNEEKLRRYEIKYGPRAPVLNAAEVLLNVATQWLPTFGPDDNGWTGPNEFILAYRAVEFGFTSRADSAKLISAGQFGVRHYFWSAAPATDNRLTRLLKPGYATFGVTMTSSADAPLVRPWGPDNRLGAFLGYGDVHAAYLFEKPRRILIGTGKQIIPYAF